MSSESNAHSNFSVPGRQLSAQQPDLMPEMHELIDESLAAQSDNAEEIADDLLSMDEERHETEVLRHRTLLRLSAPVAPPTSTIRRRPVGAPPRRAASVHIPRGAQPPSRVHEAAIASPPVSHGHGRNDSVMCASPYRNVGSTRRFGRAHESPIPVESDHDQDAPMLVAELQSDSAQYAPMLTSDLQSDHAHQEPARIIIPHYNRDSVLPTLDGSLALRVNASRLAYIDGITIREDRRHSLSAGDLVPYNGGITIYEPQPLREWADPPLVTITHHTFQNPIAGGMGTSHLRKPRDSMAATTLHRMDDVVPERLQRHVSRPYRAPRDHVVHAVGVVADALGLFRRRRATLQRPASLK
jgi:hypothetical protein